MHDRLPEKMTWERSSNFQCFFSQKLLGNVDHGMMDHKTCVSLCKLALITHIISRNICSQRDKLIIYTAVYLYRHGSAKKVVSPSMLLWMCVRNRISCYYFHAACVLDLHLILRNRLRSGWAHVLSSSNYFHLHVYHTRVNRETDFPY